MRRCEGANVRREGCAVYVNDARTARERENFIGGWRYSRFGNWVAKSSRGGSGPILRASIILIVDGCMKCMKRKHLLTHVCVWEMVRKAAKQPDYTHSTYAVDVMWCGGGRLLWDSVVLGRVVALVTPLHYTPKVGKVCEWDRNNITLRLLLRWYASSRALWRGSERAELKLCRWNSNGLYPQQTVRACVRSCVAQELMRIRASAK